MAGIRIGIGYDVHAFSKEAGARRLVIGGADIPYEFGLLGHSDADVLVHALMDAMLGALALGDIGEHFPDTDAKYRDISSMKLLSLVRNIVEDEGYKLSNADMTIIAEKPRMSPYIPVMREALAEALGAALSDISIKATTTERLGFTGREEGIATQAAVTLERI